jgi:glycerol uptake facilitator-like aquaporin
VSGAHFNPAVTFVQTIRRTLAWREAVAYALVQVLGCCIGAVLAHAMFELPWIQSSAHARSGPAQWLAEAVATCGLALVVLGHRRAQDAPWMVAAWIGAAYWFTASTSFANRAITIARSLSDTFAGIRPQRNHPQWHIRHHASRVGLTVCPCRRFLRNNWRNKGRISHEVHG